MAIAPDGHVRWNGKIRLALSLLILIYAAARLTQAFPDKVPVLAIVFLHVFPPAVFALVHGAIAYRVRGILTFVVLCLLVGNVFENLSIVTGFPFGHYHFTDVMGPKVFQVPMLLALAYVGMGYLSWTLGRLILGSIEKPLSGLRILTLPLIASFIMVAWDVSMDPIWSTLLRAWIWHQGGAYFGVPITNFLGWYLTVLVIYQLFALYLSKRPTESGALTPTYWKLAVLFYGISAIGNLLVIPAAGPSEVSDAAGKLWKPSTIIGASAVASIFTMGAFTILAWVRITDGVSNVRKSRPRVSTSDTAEAGR